MPNEILCRNLSVECPNFGENLIILEIQWIASFALLNYMLCFALFFCRKSNCHVFFAGYSFVTGVFSRKSIKNFQESINLTTIQNARKSQKPKVFLECVLLLTNQIKPQSKYRNVQSQLENTLVTTLTRL